MSPRRKRKLREYISFVQKGKFPKEKLLDMFPRQEIIKMIERMERESR